MWLVTGVKQGTKLLSLLVAVLNEMCTGQGRALLRSVLCLLPLRCIVTTSYAVPYHYHYFKERSYC
uniref:Uncharacterized protein n=1 Tax=Anguilla anguilla TaxID=7936 RepID=A0A0E9WYU5_ANGAN